MDLFDPVLDRALSVDYDELAPEMRNRLGNGELFFAVDGATDLHDLFWPWTDAVYARHIRMRLTDLYDDEFSPLVTRFFPGFQETIIGTEGMIVSKRLMPPFKSSYDRAVLWILECQAEGDRLLRIDVHIDWGEPLSQRMVDGLLVAQENPQSAQGIYKQKNADSTRVFGNPQARPDHVDLDDPNGAHLVYHVLVNGQVEVPLLMTVSDVGEQVAWNGFLAQRDCARTFELSVKEWDALLQRGRLWTPYPPLNAVANGARIAATRRVQRFRTGTAAADRRVIHAQPLVDVFDLCEPVQSHNLLALLRRLTERGDGRIPTLVPLHPKDALPDPGDDLPATAAAYVPALAAHLARHGDDDLLADHADAVQAVLNALVQARARGEIDAAAPQLRTVFDAGIALAQRGGWSADGARWESEAAQLPRAPLPPAPDLDEIRRLAAQQHAALAAPDLAAPDALAPAAALAFVWSPAALGLHRTADGRFGLAPAAFTLFPWWALVDVPHDTDGRLTLVWDGATLHATAPVDVAAPLMVHSAIRVRHSDELNFDLQFEFIDDSDGERRVTRFRPQFFTSEPAP